MTNGLVKRVCRFWFQAAFCLALQLLACVACGQYVWVEDVNSHVGAWQPGTKIPRSIGTRKFLLSPGSTITFKLVGCDPLSFRYAVTATGLTEPIPAPSSDLIHLLPPMPAWNVANFPQQSAGLASTVGLDALRLQRMHDLQADYEEAILLPKEGLPSHKLEFGSLSTQLAAIQKGFSGDLQTLKNDLTSLKTSVDKFQSGSGVAIRPDPIASYNLEAMTNWAELCRVAFDSAAQELSSRLLAIEQKGSEIYVLHLGLASASIFVDIVDRGVEKPVQELKGPTLILVPDHPQPTFDLCLFVDSLHSSSYVGGPVEGVVAEPVLGEDTGPLPGVALLWTRPFAISGRPSRLSTSLGVGIDSMAEIRLLAGLSYRIGPRLGLTAGLVGGQVDRLVPPPSNSSNLPPIQTSSSFLLAGFVGVSYRL